MYLPAREQNRQSRYSRTLYEARHNAEKMSGKLRDWLRILTRFGQCVHTSFSAILITASVIFYLINES